MSDIKMSDIKMSDIKTSDINLDQIVPYCIHHYVDLNTNTYHGYIGEPAIVNQDGNIIYKCLDNTNGNGYDDKWVLYGSFYVVSPMVRPIPDGLKLINANKSGKYPYNTQSVNYSYDVFNVEPNSVSFLAWTRPLQGTVPLYLHITPNGGAYPSFDKNPPQQEGWTENIISPIYVLVDPDNYSGDSTNLLKFERDKNNILQFKFKPIQGRCMPDPEGDSLNKCFLLTDEISKLLVDAPPTSLLDLVKKEEKRQTIESFFKTLSPVIISITVIFFLLSLIICIAILLNNPTKKS
jgi:hypothetical protein